MAVVPRPSKILTTEEVRWRDTYESLLSKGFRLRKRYHPKWKPTWTTDKYPSAEDAMELEDEPGDTNDALVIGRADLPKQVVLKFATDTEIEILKHLHYVTNEGEVNHIIPLLDVVPCDDGGHILVMPFCGHIEDKPYFTTSTELLNAVLQITQGLEFMHRHRVAQGNVHLRNLVEDRSKLVPDGFHFIRNDCNAEFTRPIKVDARGRSSLKPLCYLADFSAAKIVMPGDGANAMFLQDVRQLGHMIDVLHTNYRNSLPLLTKLTDRMMDHDEELSAKSVVKEVEKLLEGNPVALRHGFVL
ncbi:Kinase-like protein [Mycena indigotica]|uniref:Kinase-like protein n=1 Tax=Mycena indigotica TaxID=2126181 RepID=A0A8H6TE91_9AGAR|nr:Kinase-like protein [Mycena indigotica]KAF7316088.1 Kinase-like protein [Mycena indigotica]